jgi:hypothetical protein
MSDEPLSSYRSAEGDVTLEIDRADEVIRLKAVATFDAPVELTADAARELAHKLIEFAELID